jgi:hypothetical protein
MTRITTVVTAKTPPPDNTRTRTDLGKNQSNDQRLRTRTARLLTPGRRSRRPTPRRHRDRQSATARRHPSDAILPRARGQDAAAAIARRHPAVTGRPNAATPSPAVAQRQASRRRSPPQTARPTPGRKSSSV